MTVGFVGAGGTLGIIIRPRGILMIYGVLAQQDIARLSIAGIVPGIVRSGRSTR
ncbi:MAG: hypothetical protein JXA57_17655 [Armatimonadetes bacterium]|nr:hypothetical protein [Armatimonadota bacterium]